MDAGAPKTAGDHSASIDAIEYHHHHECKVPTMIVTF